MKNIPKYVVVKTKQELELHDNKKLKTNTEYIIPAGWLGMMVMPNQVTLISEDVGHLWKPYNISRDLNGKSLLIQRASGFGDMLFTSPIIKYIRLKYPKIKELSFATNAKYKSILKAIPGIDTIHTMPLEVEILKQYDYHISFMSLIEGGQEDDRNIYKKWFSAIGVTNPSHDFCLPIIKDDIPVIKTEYPKTIGIQPFGGLRLKDLHPRFLANLIPELIARKYHIILFAEKTEPRLGPLTQILKDKVSYSFDYLQKDKTIYGSLQIAKGCDCMLSCDSVFAHAGPALGVDTISVYGPFCANAYTKHYRHSWSIDTGPVCRCRSHSTPECMKYGYPSPCMDIDIKYILDIIDSQLNKSNHLIIK